VGFAGYFCITGCGRTINESQVDHRGLPAAELRPQANLRTTSISSHGSRSRTRTTGGRHGRRRRGECTRGESRDPMARAHHDNDAALRQRGGRGFAAP
jgi:hypothetical protein